MTTATITIVVDPLSSLSPLSSTIAISPFGSLTGTIEITFTDVVVADAPVVDEDVFVVGELLEIVVTGLSVVKVELPRESAVVIVDAGN